MDKILQKQPPAISNNEVIVWQEVIKDYRRDYNHAFVDDIIELMSQRNTFGIQKHKTPLQPNNGRNTLFDGIQEALDLSAYLKCAILEGKDIDNNLKDAYKKSLEILEVLYCVIVDKEE